MCNLCYSKCVKCNFGRFILLIMCMFVNSILSSYAFFGGIFMTFGEKLLLERTKQHLTQQQLADKAGVSRKSIYNFEKGITIPKSKKTYTLLANALEIDEQYLSGKTDNDRNLDDKQQVEKLVQEMGALFAGGTLSDKDLDGVMRAMQEHYWKAKELNQNNADE